MLYEIITKYEEKTAFNSLSEIKKFTEAEIEKWQEFDDKFGSEFSNNSIDLGMRKPWTNMLSFFNGVSVAQMELMHPTSTGSNSRIEEIVRRLDHYIKESPILIYNSIEGRELRKHIRSNQDFFKLLCTVLSVFDEAKQFASIDLTKSDGQKVIHVIIKCRLEYELKHFKAQIKKTSEENLVKNIEELRFYKERYEEIFDRVETLRSEAETNKTEFSEFIDSSHKSFEEFYQKSQAGVSNIEEAYKGKMTINEPIKYWEGRRTDYRSRSLTFGILTGVVAAFFVLLILLGLYYMPDMSSIKNVKDQIKFTILFITGIGVLTYLLNIISRIFLSSLHLLADIDERSNLTHFYISLIQGGNIEAKDREIILQSLFSRTESGIIKGGTEFSMPGSLETFKTVFKK